MDRVYFDNSATTRVAPEVIEVMTPYFAEEYGNASSLHSFGAEAEEGMRRARAQVAQAVGAEPDEIVFTSGGTESDNLALQGYVFANKEKGKHIITSAIEHHAVLHTCEFLEDQGFEVTYLPVDEDGLVSLDRLQEAIREDTLLVSVMAANNEIGTVQPVRAMGEIAEDHDVAFHTDAVQYVTKVPFDVGDDHVTLAALSAHKFHGPKGVGALFVKKGTKLQPLVYGGGHERGLRSSTENVPGIVGMGRAIEMGVENMAEHVSEMTGMRDRIISGVLGEVPDSHLNGHPEERLCNNAHFGFDFIEGESLVLRLDMEGIATSTGSACSTGTLEPSHVLLAIGQTQEQAHSSLRISLSRMNTMEEVDYFLEVIGGTVEQLRAMSPLGKGTET